MSVTPPPLKITSYFSYSVGASGVVSIESPLSDKSAYDILGQAKALKIPLDVGGQYFKSDVEKFGVDVSSDKQGNVKIRKDASPSGQLVQIACTSHENIHENQSLGERLEELGKSLSEKYPEFNAEGGFSFYVNIPIDDPSQIPPLKEKLETLPFINEVSFETDANPPFLMISSNHNIKSYTEFTQGIEQVKDICVSLQKQTPPEKSSGNGQGIVGQAPALDQDNIVKN